jgi:FixJ family two-component response regulator
MSGRTGGSSGGPRVYVVDDDEVLLAAVTRLLARAGYDVEAFSSPRAFLDRARPEATSCVLLDVEMPGLSGLDLQELLGRAGASPAILFMTAHADVPATIRAFKGGAVDLLQKPFDNVELLEAVALASRRATASAGAEAVRDAAIERLASLTPREREVCGRIAAGKKNREIAAELGMAESTVGLHRARIMKKVRAGSLADLVLLVERAGGEGALS